MVFTGDLQHRRKRSRIRLYLLPDPLSNMLIDQENSNILASRGEFVKGLSDGGIGGAGVDNEEVLLGIRGRRGVGGEGFFGGRVGGGGDVLGGMC